MLLYCIWHFALYLLMYGLDADARPWKPIPWSSLRTVLELIWRPHEVWRSVAIDSAESWRLLSTMRLSIRWPRSIILRGLPLCGWVAVVPNHFHFVIIPLTVDCGIFRSEEISRLDLLHRWHPITVPHWNSLSSWERPILFTNVCRNSLHVLVSAFIHLWPWKWSEHLISMIWMGEWILIAIQCIYFDWRDFESLY